MTPEVTERFGALLDRPEADVKLDEAALLIAAHAHPDLEIERFLSRFDELAARVPPPGASGPAESLARHLFVAERFTGNERDYADPRNSFLDDVLNRRLGIPITLSIVMLEVGRRLAIPLAGVGMPGHFLVRTADGADPEFFDAFAGGRRLSAADCADRFAELYPTTRFDPAFLAPVGTRAIVSRMLANLEHTMLTRRPAAVVWVVRLQLLVPGLPPAARRRFAARLGSLGSFAEAADVLDALAADAAPGPDSDVTPELGDGATRDELAARALRARAN